MNDTAALNLSGTHERQAVETLRETTLEHYPALRDAVAAAAHAVHELRIKGDDVVVAMAKTNVLSLACETLAKAAEELHKSADAALIEAMASTGCTSIFSANLNVSLVQGARSVDVTDRNGVPADLWTQPEPRPDLTKIRQHLKVVGDTNYARLIDGKPHLRRTSAQ
jgi:hypothetical protein